MFIAKLAIQSFTLAFFFFNISFRCSKCTEHRVLELQTLKNTKARVKAFLFYEIVSTVSENQPWNVSGQPFSLGQGVLRRFPLGALQPGRVCSTLGTGENHTYTAPTRRTLSLFPWQPVAWVARGVQICLIALLYIKQQCRWKTSGSFRFWRDA